MTNLTKEIESFISSAEAPVAFCGAGVAAKAGLPVWSEMLRKLAEDIEENDPATFAQMIDCLDSGLLEKAADYYFMSHKIEASTRYTSLTKLLSDYDSRQLTHLVSLPFIAYITTNYDKALHNCYSALHNSSCIEVHYGDPSLAEAPFFTEPYIARIHGRAEVPRQLILRSDDLAKLEHDETYKTFLLHHLTRSQILFVGYSFLDPAIRNILRLFKSNALPSLHKGRHIALLPNNVDSDLAALFESASIRILNYSHESNHKELWNAFSLASEGQSSAKIDSACRSGHYSYSLTKRFLATCYARSKLTARIEPLYSSVLEGVVARIIEDEGAKGITFDQLRETLGLLFPISNDEIRHICSDCIERLCKAHHIENNNGVYFPKGDGDEPEDAYAIAVNRLLLGVANRAKVRESIDLTGTEREYIKELIDQIVMQRGWDLGAAFASRRIPEELDVREVAEGILDEKSQFNCVRARRILRSIESLLRSPEPEEMNLLVEIGRVSFALELVSQSPRSNYFLSSALPQKIYLDTNVLLPAIVEHHPFHSLYNELLRKLNSASSGAGTHLTLCVFSGFLNEIIAHRRKALEMYSSQKDVDEATFDRRRTFLGLENMNVYLGAYHSFNQGRNEINFEDFLRRQAPYEDEGELRTFLETRGFSIIGDASLYSKDSIYPKLYGWLEREYAGLLERERKTGPVLEHDAKQLALLSHDIEEGSRTLLVTADRGLRRMIGNDRYSDLANLMISHVGLAQFVDLVVGRVSQTRSMAKLIWSTKSSSFAEDVREHLINQALKQHEAAYIMPMHDLVDEIAEDLVFELERRRLSVDSEEASVREEIDSVFDQFEEKFFEGMRKEIERRYDN